MFVSALVLNESVSAYHQRSSFFPVYHEGTRFNSYTTGPVIFGGFIDFPNHSAMKISLKSRNGRPSGFLAKPKKKKKLIKNQ